MSSDADTIPERSPPNEDSQNPPSRRDPDRTKMRPGDPDPWHPLDLPWDEAPDWDAIPRDRAVRPALDDVLAVRRDRHAMVGGVRQRLTPRRRLAQHRAP